MEKKALCFLLFVQLLRIVSGAARWNAEAKDTSSPPVKLRRLPDSVVMDNGLTNVTLTTPDGHIGGIQYNGVENLVEPKFSPEQRGYWDLVAILKDVSTQDRLGATEFKVIAEDGNKVELSFTRIWNHSLKGSPPMNIDKRYVMLRGSPGFYTYSIYERTQGMPATIITQTRLTLKLSGKSFHFMAISDQRQRYMPTPLDRENARSQELEYHEARLLTSPENPDHKGEVDDKFQYSKDNKDNVVHGWISDDTSTGLWLISPSMEYRSGGPFKQELSSHVGPTAMVVFFSNHYSGDELSMNFTQGEAWKKVYGPVFIYVNSAPTKNPNELHSSLWADAKAQTLIEQQNWPYSFPMSNDYPHADHRGTARGRLQTKDKYLNHGAPTNAANAHVGLAPKGDEGSWQRENKAYQFWNQTDAEGNFFLKGVRPGTYNLYASVPGHVGRYIYKLDVAITPGCALELGDLVHEPPRSGPTLWEIGIPDGTAAEFFIPDANPKYVNKLFINNDKFRQYGLWERYAELYPNDLVFNVGSSNYSKDFYFAHNTRKVNNEFRPTSWQINFDLPSTVPNGNYTLQVALACANFAVLRIFVNQNPLDGQPVFRTGQFGEDNAIARHGIHGIYWFYSVPIPGKTLITGKNKIFLNHRFGLAPFVGNMYDYLRLEGPPT